MTEPLGKLSKVFNSHLKENTNISENAGCSSAFQSVLDVLRSDSDHISTYLVSSIDFDPSNGHN